MYVMVFLSYLTLQSLYFFKLFFTSQNCQFIYFQVIFEGCWLFCSILLYMYSKKMILYKIDWLSKKYVFFDCHIEQLE